MFAILIIGLLRMGNKRTKRWQNDTIVLLQQGCNMLSKSFHCCKDISFFLSFFISSLFFLQKVENFFGSCFFLAIFP